MAIMSLMMKSRLFKNEEEVPIPIDEEKYKGRIAYRTTGSRHVLLVKEVRRRQSISKVLDEIINTSQLRNFRSS